MGQNCYGKFNVSETCWMTSVYSLKKKKVPGSMNTCFDLRFQLKVPYNQIVY